MDINEYKIKAKSAGYQEQLTYIVASETTLSSFLKYEDLGNDLKVHLVKVMLSRHFPATGGLSLPADIDWFIGGFLHEFKGDLVKPWISTAINKALIMIISEDTFGKGIVGTTFMFGVVEFYIKYRLGYRPEQYDDFDTEYHKPFRNMFLGAALNKLKKSNSALAKDINFIDKYNASALKKAKIKEQRFTRAKMADRLTLARNAMVHGETHTYYSTGKYIAMIYLLLHFHGLADGTKYEGR